VAVSDHRRHPAEVTADRLIDHTLKYDLDGSERDAFGYVIFLLHEIADDSRPNGSGW
jgi:hypothetical protein